MGIPSRQIGWGTNSNLLWQISNSKIYFTDRPWPDFDAVELDAALALIDN